jgi:hypothetical protein
VSAWTAAAGAEPPVSAWTAAAGAEPPVSAPPPADSDLKPVLDVFRQGLGAIARLAGARAALPGSGTGKAPADGQSPAAPDDQHQQSTSHERKPGIAARRRGATDGRH